MEKHWRIIACASLSLVTLAACGKEEAGRDRYTDSTQPIGYYSNDNDGNFGRDTRQGPVSELVDHNNGVGSNEQRHNRGQYNDYGDQMGNPAEPINEYGRNFFSHNGEYSENDRNYHQHMSMGEKPTRSSYFSAYSGELADRINEAAGGVDNVKGVHSVVYQDDVIIAVDVEDESKRAETEREVKQAATPYLNNKDCQVVTEPGMYTRVRQIEYDLRDGGPMEGLENDLQDMVQSLRLDR